MLIGPNGVRISHVNCFSCLYGSDTVRDNPVVCKITTPKHISRSCRGHCHRAVCKKTVFITVRHQFRTAFTVAVWVETIQRLFFPVAPAPFVIMIDFIRRHIDNTSDTRRSPYAFHKINRSHDIGFIGIPWFPVAVSYDRLRSQMKDDLRLSFCKYRLQTFKIPDIAPDICDLPVQSGILIQVGNRRRLQCIPGYRSPCIHQYPAKPGSFEAGVPGHEHFSAFVKAQIFQIFSSITSIFSMGQCRVPAFFPAVLFPACCPCTARTHYAGRT